MQPSKKKPGLTKKLFIFTHNKLCQTMVKFWLDHSLPSPTKRMSSGNTWTNQVSTSKPTMKKKQLTSFSAWLQIVPEVLVYVPLNIP